MGVRYWGSVLTALFLAACGGGGVDPGACSGSPKFCAGLTNGGSGFSSNTGGTGTGTSAGAGTGSTDGGSTTPVYITNAQLQTGVSCTDIMQANGGRTANAWLVIQDAYQRGASNLDGDPQNGVPCDSYGFPV